MMVAHISPEFGQKADGGIGQSMKYFRRYGLAILLLQMCVVLLPTGCLASEQVTVLTQSGMMLGRSKI